MYIAYLARSLKYQSVVNYLAAVKVLHVMFEYDVTPFSGFMVTSTLKGYRGILGDHVERKLPLTPEILHGIIAACDPDKESGFIAALLVGFFTFMRKSNLVPRSVEAFQPGKQLCRGSFQPTEFGFLVKLTGTKTIQFNERVLYIPLVRSQNNSLCPVRALQHHWELHPSDNNDDPAFVAAIKKGEPVFLTHAKFVRLLKAKLSCVDGIDPSRYSGHSLRRGGASFAHQCGVGLEMIQIMGDWCSLAVLLYLTRPLVERLKVAHIMCRKV